VIRGAWPHERALLTELQRRASLMWEDDRQALLDHPDAIDLPQGQIDEGRVFVCEHEGRVLGFGVVLPRADGAAELDGLFVEPSMWRRGTGRALIDHAVRAAKAAGASNLLVVANYNALGFYRACGFQSLGEVETRFSPGVQMVLTL
jgi:GNAT superfamily N-acetyltransferase